MSKHNPTRQIELRQRGEDHVSKFQGVAAQHQRLKLSANWETKTQSRIETNHMARAMDVVQARHDEVLVARRQRLTELLQDERKQHEYMLENMAVTDDQRRERLMQQARDLRAKRETLRKGEATAQKDRRFREQSALVREAESHIKVLHVAEERKQQIEEKQRRKEAEREESAFWEEQQREEMRKQALRSQADLQRLHTRAQDTRKNLDVQVRHNEERRHLAKQEEVEEDKVYGESIKVGLKADAEKEAGRRQHQRDIAHETKVRNDAIRLTKEAEHSKLREEEKVELDNLLAKIAEDEKREGERKRAAREDAKYQMKFVEAQMNAAAESETALDRQWQEENDRQWAKREQQWRKEQHKREATMVDVFKTRKDQIVSIRQKEIDDQTARRNEHEKLVAVNQSMMDQDAELKARQRATALDTQKYLGRQISEREAEKATGRDARRNELTAAGAEEHAYQDKIALELTKLDQAKPGSYQHVKLGSRKKPLGY